MCSVCVCVCVASVYVCMKNRIDREKAHGDDTFVAFAESLESVGGCTGNTV